MPLVRATESGKRQTESYLVRDKKCGVIGPVFRGVFLSSSFLEKDTIEGDSPVGKRNTLLIGILSRAYWILSLNLGDTNFQP